MRFFLLVGIAGAVWWGWVFSQGDHDRRERFGASVTKEVWLELNGLTPSQLTSQAETVSAALTAIGLAPTNDDALWPAADTKLTSGMRIILLQARPLTLVVDGRTLPIHTTARTNDEVLAEQHILLDEDDIVETPREYVSPSQAVIRVTRVEIREEHRDTKIDFITKTNEDSALSWRVKKVTQKGEPGTRRTMYRVSYHDGREVRRKVIGTETLKEPVSEIVTQGTYVKLGKSHRGAASWYAFTGTMAAANPWLPKGSYVKVTNVDNGKSVIVVINDRGPFVPGRIIDLDKVAFTKIASVGAGVINVKMEEIVN